MLYINRNGRGGPQRFAEGIVSCDPLLFELEIDSIGQPLKCVSVNLPRAQLLLRERIKDSRFATGTRSLRATILFLHWRLLRGAVKPAVFIEASRPPPRVRRSQNGAGACIGRIESYLSEKR